jgi:hypothetical protein
MDTQRQNNRRWQFGGAGPYRGSANGVRRDSYLRGMAVKVLTLSRGETEMLILLLILLLVFGGGGGYYGYHQWGAGGGAGIVLVVLLALFLFGRGRI